MQAHATARMQAERSVFFWLLIFTISSCASRRHGGVQTAPRTSSPVSSSVRRWNGTGARKVSSPVATVASNLTQYVTKVQVEDLDLATSVECIRLHQVDFCDDSGPGTTVRYPSAAARSPESDSKRSLRSYLKDPSCRLSLRPFLCVALTATCSFSSDDAPAALPPCRSLCSAAEDGCRGVRDARGIDWPDEWSCDQYPVEGLCLDQPLHHSTGLKNALDDRSQVPGSQTFSIESRGSLQPPPSSAFDNDLLASPNEPVSSSQLGTSRSEGGSRFFRGWADVQGLGHANDYCRVSGNNSRERILSCAINGTALFSYTSKQGFDAGRPGSGFMKDVDGDRRDDYCRCVGNIRRAQLICMKAGEHGFYGGKMQPGSEFTIRIQASDILASRCRSTGNNFS